MLDQACRHFFCDRNFVCNRNTNACVPCDPNAAPGEGGCAETFINGGRSQILMSKTEFEAGEPECGNRSFGQEQAFSKGLNGG